MKELLTALIGKRCRIHMMDESLADNTYTIKTVTDAGVLCEGKHGNTVIANIEYICSVEEIKEKKKSGK